MGPIDLRPSRPPGPTYLARGARSPAVRTEAFVVNQQANLGHGARAALRHGTIVLDLLVGPRPSSRGQDKPLVQVLRGRRPLTAMRSVCLSTYWMLRLPLRKTRLL